LDKKGFLIGDVTVYTYSIIALVVISLAFYFLFYTFSAKEKVNEFLNIYQKEFNINSVNPKIELYETLTYFIYTRVIVDKKEASLVELIPLYCYNKDEKIKGYIEKISFYLLPKKYIYGFDCEKKQETKEIDPLDITKVIIGETEDKTEIKTINPISPEHISMILPSINKEQISLDLIYSLEIQENEKVETTFTQEDFNEKLNSAYLLISPSKYLWVKRENSWCEPINNNCQLFFSDQELIKCNGDLLLCLA